MKRQLFVLSIIISLFLITGCGGGGGGLKKVNVNLKKPETSHSELLKSLSWEDILTSGKYATYITCEMGTNFNGGYAYNLNQWIPLVARITDLSGNPIPNLDKSQINWQNPDPLNIFTTYATGESTQLDIRKVGKYAISASYQGNLGHCQAIAYNATYIGDAESYLPPMPDYQGVVFDSDSSVTQTNDITAADLYIDYSNSDNSNFTIVAPSGGGIAIVPAESESWNQLNPIFLYQFGNLAAVPNLIYNAQISLPVNVPQILVLKKRGNSGYVKLAIMGCIMTTKNYVSIVYAVSSETTFPLAFD